MKQLRIGKQITNRENQSFEKYLQEISKVNLLSSGEEVILAQKIKQGDEQALQKLIKANLRFVISVAKQYQNNGLTLNDLVNEGNLGLIKAAKRFDSTKGFKFISYAVWWIRQSIIQALAEHSRIVRLPFNKLSFLNDLNKTFAKLEQDFEREPLLWELSEALQVSEQDVATMIGNSKKHLSMDASLKDSDDSQSYRLYDLIENKDNAKPDSALMCNSVGEEIGRMLNILNRKEANLIMLCFGLGRDEPMNIDEIARKFSLTRERVRQIKKNAIQKLKLYFQSKHFKDLHR